MGSIVTVFARQLHIIAYGDEATRKAVEARAQRWADREEVQTTFRGLKEA